ncbi:MAG: TRAP transporter small permease [Anaerotignum sp.]|jgi:C4-dicarboxylate transporter DctQ subunit|nr:TRAP transporter small permease [Anaerotignum sp.]
MRFVLGIWSKLEEFILVILFAFMAVMNFINVVFRYCFSQSFSFTEEITITAFVWVSMIGIAAAYKRLAHMGMSFFVENMPKKIQPFMALLSMLCSVVLMVLLMKYGADMVSNQIRLNSRTAALNMPMWVQGLSIPIGSFFCIIRSIEAGIGEFKRLNKEAKGVEAA